MAAKGIAVLGIDQVETGTRRGASTEPPDDLVYNFANPSAARGNFVQGAADQMSLVRFATTLALSAAVSPTQAAIQAGPLAFWGHSQGATEGGIALPFTAGVLGAVMSGQGASLMDALVTKTNPVDVAAALPLAIEDPKVDVNHPVVALLQNDPRDRRPAQLCRAPRRASPVAAANVKHVFSSPTARATRTRRPRRSRHFAIAAQLPGGRAARGRHAGHDLRPRSPPRLLAGGNPTSAAGTGRSTALVRQYAPSSSYDGHFVAYDNASAEADVDGFLAAAVAGKVPAVGP